MLESDNFLLKMIVKLCCVLVLLSGVLSQQGIKTRKFVPPPGSENLVMYENGTMVQFSSTNMSMSAFDKFMNQSRKEIPKGFCYEEVPTASLIKSGFVPAGNGSDPTMSKIQVCCEGFERNMHNFFKCDPVCEHECINSLCVAPNVCKCYPDFVRNTVGDCVPTCPIGCHNGECQSDNTCLCKEGFELEAEKQFCVAKCTGGCDHGACVGPETCECNNGYELGDDKKCHAICSGGCANGECVAPETCNCRPGYKKTEFHCEPVCERGCKDGLCIAPNVCSCQRGWIMNEAGDGCEAHCDHACLNGVCSGPNQCTCRRGYVQDEFDSLKCIAHCPNGCQNGVCSGPNMCLCNAGFVKDRSIKGSQACIRRV